MRQKWNQSVETTQWVIPLKGLKVKVKSLSRVPLFVTPWTVAYQAPPSMGFSGQEYQSGEPGPTPGDLPHPEIEPRSPALQADSLLSEPSGTPSPRTVRDPYPTPHLYPSLSIWLALPQIPSQVLYPR